MRLLYQELVRMHKEEGLSFRNVVTFNLDEYSGVSNCSPNSYYREMRNRLIDHVDILPENFNILPSEYPYDQANEICANYEKKIRNAGGIEYQLLGIGRTGHVGFNEPSSDEYSVTRLVHLNHITRSVATPAFGELSKVPTTALSMGIRTIMQARQITLMAWTEDKAGIVARAIEGPITSEVACSYLHRHPNCKFVLDMPASSCLTRFTRPWEIPGFSQRMKDHDFWDAKAIIWLCEKVKKPILRLARADYENNNLLPLVNFRGKNNHEHCNLWGFKFIEKNITGWPAGGRPEGRTAYFDKPSSKEERNILVFSPHPDDDAICMSGTIHKLIKQGHNVHSAEMTSGNFAVFNHEAHKFVDFMHELNLHLGTNVEGSAAVLKSIEEAMATGNDSLPLLKKVKGLIRRTEARQSMIQLGMKKENVHHLDLPFYEVNSSKKGELTQRDSDIIIELINKVRPHIIYAAGDLSDPHGTHRVCLLALIQALEILKVRDPDWYQQCKIYLYRGSWHEWHLAEATVLVPLSPVEMEFKKNAILRHQSQKDPPMFPGDDPREFWERAWERNRKTAELMHSLGFMEYEGMEVFADYSYIFDTFL
jgi:glucosamine-6-phosphate deaminase